MFQSEKTIYHIDRVVRETGEVQDNGLQEIYVNTKIDDGTDIGELMKIFTVSDAYDFNKFPNVSKRKKQFKESEGGNEEMCDLVENYAKQKAEEKAADSARKLFENGVSYDIVRASITTISDEDLQKIYEQVTGSRN